MSRRALHRTSFFDTVNATLLVLIAAICVVPVVHVFAQSFSSEGAILSGRVQLWPVEFQLRAYERVFTNTAMIRALLFTVYLTVMGTVINVIITALGAYPLSKRDLVGRRLIWLLILFTMFFSGGLIPLYMVVRSLRLLDTVWALILPGAIATFNLILMKTYFSGLPDSLAESARLDGCSEIRILFQIIMPVSMPIIATLTLFYGVGHWGEYFQALIYIQNPDKYTLQLRLQQFLEEGPEVASSVVAGDLSDTPVEAMKAAAIVFVTAPVLIVFPFLQKYFVKGALVGSLKE
jgi:ABC-type glycerol-3-phosphate transport system permease component